MSLVYLGIDPGLTGALAFFEPLRNQLAVYDVPIFVLKKSTGGTKRTVDLMQLALIVDENVKGRSVKAWIETVGARPGEAPSYAFTFGFTAGALHGCVAAHFLSIQGVTPQKWKKALGAPADKDGARYRASQLMPAHASNWPLVKHDGRAEASLIAFYGARQDGALV